MNLYLNIWHTTFSLSLSLSLTLSLSLSIYLSLSLALTLFLSLSLSHNPVGFPSIVILSLNIQIQPSVAFLRNKTNSISNNVISLLVFSISIIIIPSRWMGPREEEEALHLSQAPSLCLTTTAVAASNASSSFSSSSSPSSSPPCKFQNLFWFIIPESWGWEGEEEGERGGSEREDEAEDSFERRQIKS